VTARRPTGVRWIAWEPGVGFGDAAVAYIAALDALDLPVTWTPMQWTHGEAHVRPVQGYDGPLAHLAGRAIDHDTVVFHMSPGHHSRWLAEADGRRRLLCTTWETDRVPERWAADFRDFDAVIVPSTFNRDAFLASGWPTTVHVVPHCAPPAPPVEPARFERIGDRFVFYTIAPWSTRKAMADTISAFLDAFTADDDVALVVKTSPLSQQAIARRRRGLAVDAPRGWETASWPVFASLLAGRRNLPEIHLIPAQVPAHEIQALHARGDCFFSLTRSEGWGLNIADALRFGNPVVVTGWGGQTDYLGTDYPFLIDYDLVPTTSDATDDWFEYREGYCWARARHDHAVDVLRWVADHRDDAAAIARPAGERLLRECAPDAVARRLLDLF
jgi:glycosyltransferase involved in cell wall biosynthesis